MATATVIRIHGKDIEPHLVIINQSTGKHTAVYGTDDAGLAHTILRAAGMDLGLWTSLSKSEYQRIYKNHI